MLIKLTLLGLLLLGTGSGIQALAQEADAVSSGSIIEAPSFRFITLNYPSA